MLLVRTYLDKSTIEGIGVFANEFIPKGTIVWRFNSHLDRILYEQDSFSKIEWEFLNRYAYYDKQLNNWILPADNDRFTNHSDNPNTGPLELEVVALKDIQKGEEITIDYFNIDRYSDQKIEPRK
jgi:uncharacterized protein